MMHVKLTRSFGRQSEPVKSASKHQKENKKRKKCETTRDRKGSVSGQLKDKSEIEFPQFQRRNRKKIVSNFRSVFFFLFFFFFFWFLPLASLPKFLINF